MDASPVKFKFAFYSSDGTLEGNKGNPKSFLPKWLPPKQRKGARKNDSTSIFVYTTDELSARNSKWISDWKSEVKIGDQFWLPDGSRMEVVSAVDANLDKWNGIFQGCQNQYDRARVFSELQKADQTEFFETLNISQIIKFLKVPNKTQGQFRNPEFGLQNLVKYADLMKTAKARRRKQREERRMRETRQFITDAKKESALRIAESDDPYEKLAEIDEYMF